jgi:hypothetical protein
MLPDLLDSTMNDYVHQANVYKERRRIRMEKLKLKRMQRPRIIKKISYRRGCKLIL